MQRNHDSVNSNNVHIQLDSSSSNTASFPFKTFLLSVFLLLCGFVVIIAALPYFGHDNFKGFSMAFLGLVCAAPGSWALFVLLAAYRGYPGYTYDQVPSFEEFRL